jgi:16S rRNA (uracil1498-N3)-methyltransferase
MRNIRLYTPQILTVGGDIELDDAAANHLLRVLRANLGDTVTLFNGDGLDYQGAISAVGKRSGTVTLTEAHDPGTESPLKSHIGLCLSKGDRFDWALQKATELGVSAITPLLSERVDVKLPRERLARKQEHWQQVVASACEQSGRAVLPPVAAPSTLADWVQSVAAEVKLVLHHHQSGGLPSGLQPTSVALLIGPEGGLTAGEVNEAQSQGFLPLCLGPRVMRTETAPVAALATLAWHWGDFQSSRRPCQSA